MYVTHITYTMYTSYASHTSYVSYMPCRANISLVGNKSYTINTPHRALKTSVSSAGNVSSGALRSGKATAENGACRPTGADTSFASYMTDISDGTYGKLWVINMMLTTWDYQHKVNNMKLVTL